jgi:RimJ/RimL family protein N-acetyltransferase
MTDRFPFQWPLRRVALRSHGVRLEPLEKRHADELFEWSSEEKIWQYMTFAKLDRRSDLDTWLESAMHANEAGTEMNFAIVDEPSGKAVGGTSFYRVVPEHRRLEVGKTWLGSLYRRTHINTAAKYLLLSHAFETLHANRVELNTDSRNLRSQRAMERIGAVRDGVLRAHTIMRDGYVRDTVNYSFIASEWPGRKLGIETLLAP